MDDLGDATYVAVYTILAAEFTAVYVICLFCWKFLPIAHQKFKDYIKHRREIS